MNSLAYGVLKRESMHHVQITSVLPQTLVQKAILFGTFTNELRKEKNKASSTFLKRASNTKLGEMTNT